MTGFLSVKGVVTLMRQFFQRWNTQSYIVHTCLLVNFTCFKLQIFVKWLCSCLVYLVIVEAFGHFCVPAKLLNDIQGEICQDRKSVV